MTPEQCTWTDNQWAEHLQCLPTDVPRFRNFVRENYFIAILGKQNSDKKYIEIGRLQTAPSGAVRYTPVVSTKPRIATLDEMVDEANNKLIPSLCLSDLAAKYNRVPAKVLQMLHIEKQK